MVENSDDVYELINLEIMGSFSVGSRYTRSCIKEILKDIYAKYEIKRTPKYYDIQGALSFKPVIIRGERMLEITGKKM